LAITARYVADSTRPDVPGISTPSRAPVAGSNLATVLPSTMSSDPSGA
jgi:hypothetical protein